MGIIEFFFGRVTTIRDSKLGNLTARIKGESASKTYTWTGEHELKGQKKSTTFILDGNKDGPFAKQLNSVYRIVDTLDDILIRVDKELKGRQGIEAKYKGNWTDAFYLSAVIPYNSQFNGEGNEFEITFDPIIDGKTEYVGLIWDNGRLTEIEVR